MNNHTIRKLKNKFILISTLSFTIVMFFIAGCMYAANAWIMHSESRRVLDFIADNDGEIPDYEKSKLDVQPENASEKSGLDIGSSGSSEIPRLRHLQECPQLRDGHGKPPIELFDRFI